MAIGTVLVFALSRMVERQAYPVGELPWIFASVVGLLPMMTLIACWFPARRALDVDPVAGLRSE
jgi:putative ABC transport system permease protein